MVPFFVLLMLCGAIGVLVWLAWVRVTTHLAQSPEAAELFARHVIAPLITGKKQERKVVDVTRVDVNGVVPERANTDQP